MQHKKNNNILSTFNFTRLPRDASRGFTLIELMVSLALFIIVTFALIGSLYTVNDASRKVQAMRSVMDNLNFAIETMSRTIRTGEGIDCGGGGGGTTANCPLSARTGSDTLSVKSTLGQRQYIEYRLTTTNGNGRIERRSQPLVQDSSNPGTYILSGSPSSWVAMTAPEIDIEKLVFYVDGANPTDGMQPNVIIKMEGVATVVGGTTVPFSVQTYLSQRTPETL